MTEIELRRIAEIQTGYPARSAIVDDPTGTHSLIQGRDVCGTPPSIGSNLVRFTPRTRDSSRYTVQKKDILFQARGTSQRAIFLDSVPKNTMAAASFFIIRIKNGNLLPEYVAWYLNLPETRKQFLESASGTNIPFLSRSALGELRIIVPSLHIQKKIKHIDRLWKRQKQLQQMLLEKQAVLIHRICRNAIMNTESQEV